MEGVTHASANATTQNSAGVALVDLEQEQGESTNGGSSASTTTPATPHAKPVMGSFLPSSNAKHRAVIDGLRAAPSPFSLHNRVRNKGLGLKGKRKLGQSEVSLFHTVDEILCVLTMKVHCSPCTLLSGNVASLLMTSLVLRCI